MLKNLNLKTNALFMLKVAGGVALLGVLITFARKTDFGKKIASYIAGGFDN